MNFELELPSDISGIFCCADRVDNAAISSVFVGKKT